MEGKASEFFLVTQGVAKGWTLSPTLFLIYIDGLLREIDKYPQLEVKISGACMSKLLSADDFVRLAETGPALLCLINIAFNYSNHWRYEANV